MPFDALMYVQYVSTNSLLVRELIATHGAIEAEAFMDLAIVSPTVSIAFEDHATDLTLEGLFAHVIYYK